MIKILIADDHAIVRKGLKQILAETPDMVVAGEAGNGSDLLDKARAGNWDVVILDISMPGRGGLETLKQLKSERPKIHVLILTMHPEDQYAIRVFKAGASGYLTKESAPEQLVAAIRKVGRGEKYVSPHLAEKLAYHLETGSDKPLHETLSDREYQIMCMIASGKSVGNMAEELSLSVKTISTYRARLLKKMRLKNNAEVTHYAIRKKLVANHD